MLFAAPVLAGQEPPPVMHYEAVPAPPGAITGDETDLAMASDHYDRMTVPVRLGQSRPFQFLVDTGSGRTSVSRELVSELKLSERPKAILHSATGASQVSMALLPELRMSRRSVKNISAPMLNASNIGADGILGIDSLRSQQVVFDFGQKRLLILSGNDRAELEDDAIIVRAKARQGRLVITDAIVDGERVSVILDTGSSLTVGNLALRERLARHGRLGQSEPTSLVSVTGQSLPGELATAQALEIGGARLEGLKMMFADAHTFRLLGLDRKPAILLGMNALSGFDQVAIDFADRTISLVLPKERRGG
ncbi:retroviral-like aspartic protease family protein [Sphingomonas alba]|uniref:Retroviral-like aspartic protease family protein n=1 Tax=Sphingomonas alba TaxID=2908208 RepID=A0ABT0RJ21_9SPHN|nr:retroviral-like aspartic protease family protein [Sphingomonas alba]MCL6682600.1 retroviral-like aspartic protease family protein [Sphingomonas alba]